MEKKTKQQRIDQEVADIINSKNVPPLVRENLESTTSNIEQIDHLTPKELVSLKTNSIVLNTTNLLLKLENEFSVSSKEGLYNLVEETNAYSKIDKALVTATLDVAETLLLDLITYVEDMQKKRIFPHMLEWLQLIFKYDFKNRKTFIQKTLNFTISTDVVQVEPILEYVLSLIDDKDKDMYKYYIRQYAYKALKSNEFGLADKYFRKGLQLDKTDNFALWGVLYASIHSSGQALVPYMDNFVEYESVENLLCACATPQEVKETFEKLILSAIKYVQTNDTVTGKNNVFKAFEKFVSYIPRHMDNYLRAVLLKMADICRNKKIFGPAIKYYSWAQNLREEHQIYWRLLQAKLMCSDDEELVHQSINLDKLPEYNQAMVRADAETKKYYKEISENQKINAKKTAKENTTRKRLTNLQRIIVIVSIVAVVAIASTLGGVFGYRATTKLKYIANGSLGGYSVYHAKNFSEKDVIIPSTHDKTPIVSIEAGAFAGDSTIETLTLPLTLKNIGNGAFANCVNLKKVTFANCDESSIAYAEDEIVGSLELIEAGAFEGCINLEEVVIPEGVIEIQDKVFANTGIVNISIPNSIEKIGKDVFADCNKLEEITLVNRNTYPLEWGSNWISSNAEQRNKVVVNCDIKILLDPNHSNSSQLETKVQYMKSYKIDNKYVTRSGYVFKGWYSTKECDDEQYTDENGNSLKPWDKDGSKVFYAKWEAELHEVQFDANGGTGSMPNQQIYVDQTEALDECTFTKEGYKFIGWSKNRNSKTAEYADKSNFTMTYYTYNKLYAIWQEV